MKELSTLEQYAAAAESIATGAYNTGWNDGRHESAEKFRARVVAELRRLADAWNAKGYRYQEKNDLDNGRRAFSKADVLEHAAKRIAALPVEEDDNTPAPE